MKNTNPMRRFITSKTTWKVVAGIIVGIIIASLWSQDIQPIYGVARDESISADGYAGAVPSPEMVDAKMMATSPTMDYAAAATSNAVNNIVHNRKIIRTGSLSVEVAETETAIDQVKKLVETKEGFIDSLNVYEWNYGQNKADITLRVPAADFDQTVTELKSFGKVLREMENTQDITDQYTDTEARITNLKAREEQLRKFFGKAVKVDETLAVYRELETVRFEIENMERTKLSYDKEVSYSTLQLEIIPQVVVEQIENEKWSAKNVWRGAINQVKATLRDFAEAGLGIVAYGVIWGPIVIIILVIWGIWAWRRRK